MTTKTAPATRVVAPRTRAKAPQDCVLCTKRVKVGARIGLHFASNTWVHLGCLVRKVNEDNRAADELNRQHFGQA